MRVLFDQGTPEPLRNHLTRHNVSTAYEKGWSNLENGQLLDAAERERYEVLVTTDTSLKYQQSLGSRKIGIVVLLSTSWPRMQRIVPVVIAAIEAARPGSYKEVDIPYSDS